MNQWLERLTVALVNEDYKECNDLIDNLPCFSTHEELHQAYALINGVIEGLKRAKDHLSLEMDKTKQAIKYVETTVHTQRLDVRQ